MRNEAKFLAFWVDNSRRVRVARSVLALASIATLCILTIAAGLPAIHLGLPDTFIFLDGGHRLLDGQRPHSDFYSAMGALVYVLPALGLKLAHGRAVALAYSTAIAGLILGTWCYAVCARRMSSWSSVVVALMMTAIVVAPFSLGESYYDNSYGGQYNRFGYAMAALCLFESYLPVASGRRHVLSGVSSGIVIGLLFFLKVTYFGVALLLCGASFALTERRPGRLAGMLAGSALAFAGLLAYLRFDVKAIAGDLLIAAHARTPIDAPGLARLILENASQFLLFGVFVIAVGLQMRRFIPALVGLVLACDLLLLATNTQRSGILLCASLVFVLLAHAERAFPVHRQSGALLATLILLTAAMGTSFCMDSVNGLLHGARHRQRLQAKAGFVPFDSPALADLVISESGSLAHPSEYEAFINEGIHLVQRQMAGKEKLVCLCFGNPFSYGMGLPSARGGSTALIRDFTFNGHAYPAPERLIGDADLVMVEDSLVEPRVEGLFAIASGVLARNFHLASETQNWKLYRRN